MSILVATDGQQHSDKAVKFAIELARCRKTTLCVLHIIRGKRGVENEKIIKEGMLLLEKIKDLATAYGVSVTPLLESGSEYEVILNSAATNGADIIVLGSSGKFKADAQGAVIGSVSEFIVHHAKCTVIIVR